jgi:hypothetical protein
MVPVPQATAKVSGMEIEPHSTLTSPHCGHQISEIMTTDACQFFYDCVVAANCFVRSRGLLRGLLLRKHAVSADPAAETLLRIVAAEFRQLG